MWNRYMVTVEYVNGKVEEFVMSKNVWDRYMMQVLEDDDNVEHYTIDNIMEV